MSMIKSMVAAAALAGALAAVPASALVTIGNYVPTGQTPQIKWLNNGTNGVDNGTGGTLFTITSTGTAGTAFGSFSFALPALASLVNIPVAFNLSGSVTNTPAGVVSIGGFQYLTQTNLAVSYSFTTLAPISTSFGFFPAGSVVLSNTGGQYNIIAGPRNGSSAAFTGSTAGGSVINYYSDFYDFSNVQDADFSFGFTNIQPGFNASPYNGTPTRALRTFTAYTTGSFSADVPEPQTWALLIGGFAMVGYQVRRRRAVVAA